MRAEGREKKLDLNVELERLPGFDGNGVGLARQAHSLTGPSAEYVQDG